jgi:hypothetical protein
MIYVLLLSLLLNYFFIGLFMTSALSRVMNGYWVDYPKEFMWSDLVIIAIWPILFMIFAPAVFIGYLQDRKHA